MSEDRELLELAAKAAGVDGRYASLDDFPDWMAVHHGEGVYYTSSQAWNPLIDDGDALRLAVKLCMSVKQDDPNAAIAGWSNLQRINITHSKQGPWYWKEWLRDHENDRAAATRRAIVRAAAAIGERMQ